MIQYVCDICGNLCEPCIFKIPEYTWIETIVHPNNGKKIYKYVPREVNLCNECCKKIADALSRDS